MNEQEQSLQDLQTIRTMMERSSKFISLSGLSGISAGVFALIGSFIAYPYVYGYKDFIINQKAGMAQLMTGSYAIIFNTWLFWIATITFVAAFISSFLFTWRKSRQQGTPLWGTTAKRLLWAVAVPVVTGGIFLIKTLQYGTFGLVAPGCLIFYGLGLVNASKYTVSEIKYLGYAQIVLGIINLQFAGLGLYFWAAGFGIMHIVYGVYMWYVHERNDKINVA